MSEIKTKFCTAILLGIALVIFFAYMDSIGYAMWATLDGFAAEAYETAELVYMKFFWTWAYVLIALLGITYWNFVKRDVSETVAVIITPLILLWAGLEDLLYYVFTGLPLSETMPWLNDNFFMGNVAAILGFENVTPFILYISLGLGIIILYLSLIWLKKAKW